ncbi:N-lysine methyltransferase KMT5A isoform X2 [Procambarus clarkii]|nr:N-lysine methyltransferase KMT5A-like isoform X2 [Procambarus clarkii]XP_045597858.1 N-lysine methyltransferase KMT5A-like isoform X2 [Procambarus clarkii]
MVVNGSLLSSKLGHTGTIAKRETKMTAYFSPSRSPPAADDAEVEGATVIQDSCKMASELTSAQLSRPRPSSAPSTPTKMMNGYISVTDTVGILTTPPKRTVCTRSQALKEVQLKPFPTSDNNVSVSSNGSKSLVLTQCPGHVDATSTDSGVPTVLAGSTSLTSSPLSAEDSTSPHAGPPTPHKIQALNEEKLRLDSPLSPSSAMSKLKLSLTPKKLAFNGKPTKARKKLPMQTGTRGVLQIKGEKSSKINTSTTLPNGEVKPALRNTQMTQFFPIRRSERKPKTTLIQERQKEIEERIKSNKEEGLMVKNFGAKGRGVVTTRQFAKGEFVVEYIGNLIDVREAKEREKIYALDSSKGCYNYYFTFQNQQYCIDATEESGFLGRLVNHSRNGNLVTKAVEVSGQPHLILLAKRDLEPGTEILYDYGDRSKEALEHHPWLAS